MPPSSVIPPSPGSGVALSESPTGADARFISFDNVDLAYAPGAPNAIEDVTIRIARNAFVSIVGPSGCGKSTFMELCTRLKPATRGTVIVENKQVTGPLKITGMAFQAATYCHGARRWTTFCCRWRLSSRSGRPFAPSVPSMSRALGA